MDWTDFKDVSEAIITPVIALAAAAITALQWKSQRLQLRLERYERRLAVYQRVIEFIDHCEICRGASQYDMDKLDSDIVYAEFLFPRKVLECLDEIKKCCQKENTERSTAHSQAFRKPDLPPLPSTVPRSSMKRKHQNPLEPSELEGVREIHKSTLEGCDQFSGATPGGLWDVYRCRQRARELFRPHLDIGG